MRFGTPQDIFNYGGSHFSNKWFSPLLSKDEVKHKVGTLYYPHTKGQVEVSNWQNKRIMAKTINANMFDLSQKLVDALCVYRRNTDQYIFISTIFFIFIPTYRMLTQSVVGIEVSKSDLDRCLEGVNRAI